MSRTYALILLSIFTVGVVAYVLYGPRLVSLVELPYQQPISSKEVGVEWPQYLEDCGAKVIVENYLHARSVFNQKYEGNTVAWEG